MAKLLVLVALLLFSSLAGSRPAHAGELDSLGRATLYIVPTGGAVFCGAANGLYLAYDEGIPKYWRTAGYIFGGAAVVVGIYTLYDNGSDNATEISLGVAPIVVGAGAATLAFLNKAPDDIVGPGSALAPTFYAGGGGGFVLTGSF